jgi:hypothetical protein
MDTIKLNVKNKELKISVSEKICEGFYYVDSKKEIKKNNDLLDIKFDSVINENELQHRVTKIEEYAFVTTKSTYGYYQYILLPSIIRKSLINM